MPDDKRHDDRVATVRESVLECLTEVLPSPLPSSWKDDAPLQEADLDSAGVIELVSSLEARFGFQLEDEALSAENFATLGGLVHLVETLFDAGGQ